MKRSSVFGPPSNVARNASYPIQTLRSFAMLVTALFAFSGVADAQPKAVCPRPIAGATVENPPELRSQNGVLEIGLHLRYQQTLASEGPPRYCYLTDDGLESPTLRVRPGDRLIIHLHNDLPEWHGYRPPPHKMDDMPKDDCSATSMDPSITNLHFHGMTIPPVCHQDEVIRTAVRSGQVFDYRITIPSDEPPGLYWYHPHPHGFTERQVQGGASGALIVEGLQQTLPSLADFDERILVLRDQQRIGPGSGRTVRSCIRHLSQLGADHLFAGRACDNPNGARWARTVARAERRRGHHLQTTNPGGRGRATCRSFGHRWRAAPPRKSRSPAEGEQHRATAGRAGGVSSDDSPSRPGHAAGHASLGYRTAGGQRHSSHNR